MSNISATYQKRNYFFQSHFDQLDSKSAHKEHDHNNYYVTLINTLTDNIVLGAEWFNNCLVSVAPESLNDDLQDGVARHKVIAVKQLPPLNTISYIIWYTSSYFYHSCLRLYLLYIHLSSAVLFQIRAKKLGEGSKPSRLAWRQRAQR
jgi:hypothetical protein